MEHSQDFWAKIYGGATKCLNRELQTKTNKYGERLLSQYCNLDSRSKYDYLNNYLFVVLTSQKMFLR